jgi:hypothetical protein
MTTPSMFETVGLTIAISAPLVKGGAWLFDMEVYDSYSHTISSFGGYTSASIGATMPIDELDQWILNGLGRDVKVYAADGKVVWKGFVNSISVTLGPLSYSIGPLGDIGNFIIASYTPIIDPNADPVVTGTQTETVAVQDAISQDRYGMIEKFLSAGTCLQEDAEYARDVFLAETKDPPRSKELSIGGGEGGISISLECAGYFEWFKYYVYNGGVAQSTTALLKLQAIIDADPNSIFSHNYAQMYACPVLVSELEDKNNLADSIIQSIIALGDGADERILFGVYDDEVVYYEQIPTAVEYMFRYSAEEQTVEDINGTPVKPWHVRPGKFVSIPDLMIGSLTSADLKTDLQIQFIESVNFTAPNQISLTGGKVNTLPQMMARMGLGGTA